MDKIQASAGPDWLPRRSCIRGNPAATPSDRGHHDAPRPIIGELLSGDCGRLRRRPARARSGRSAIWVRDRLTAAGREVRVAHARGVRDVTPLACKTDKVDARVLAELCRRDRVPELWVPSLQDRELRERLRRRMHLVGMRAWAMNRIFGLLTQWGLRLSL
jgi:Transposase